MGAKKILVIEDEPNIRELVLYNLKTNGYDGLAAEDGIMGITMVHREKPDLILLDIMLPEKNGYEICRELREEGNDTPIIMITAKTEETDKVMGLEYGADDYIAKPFGVMELVARVKARLRGVQKPTEDYTVGALYVCPKKHIITVDGAAVTLTRKEFEMLCFLLENRGQVLTRDQILNHVWGYAFDGENRTVDVHIRTLRQKLGTAGDLVETIRGIGYKVG